MSCFSEIPIKNYTIETSRFLAEENILINTELATKQLMKNLKIKDDFLAQVIAEDINNKLEEDLENIKFHLKNEEQQFQEDLKILTGNIHYNSVK